MTLSVLRSIELLGLIVGVVARNTIVQLAYHRLSAGLERTILIECNRFVRRE